MTRKSRFAGVYPSGKSHWMYRISLPRDPVTGKRGQEVKGGFATDQDASDARKRRLVAMGQLPASALTERRTLSQFASDYLDRHALEVDASTIYNYRGIVTRYIDPHIGATMVRDVTSDQVRTWLARLTREHSPNVARTARRMLVQILRVAVVDEIVTRNVAAVVKAPRYEPKKPKTLNADEIGRLLETAATDKLAALWYLALLCQLRPGELAGLRWADLDLDRARITIRNTRTRNEQGKWVIGDGAKTNESHRAFDIPAVCVVFLKEHRRAQLAFRLQAPPGWWHDHDLVFPTARGEVMGNSTLEYALSALCTRAGVPVITPHGLRHSGASWARHLGESPEVVSQRLGHRSVQFTLDHYSHTDDDDQRIASERLEAALDALRRRPG